jgi:hypothetical protein
MLHIFGVKSMKYPRKNTPMGKNSLEALKAVVRASL